MSEDGQPTRAQNGEATQAEGQPSNAEQRYSKADLDGHAKGLKERLTKDFAKREAELAKSIRAEVLEALELDAEDVETAKAKLASLRGTESVAQQSEAKLKKLARERDEAVQALQTHVAKQREAELRGKVLEIAGPDCVDPQALYLVLKGEEKIGWEGDAMVVRDEHGEIDHGSSIDKLVKNTLAARPYLARATQTTGSGSRAGAVGVGNNGSAPSLKDQRLAALAEIYGPGRR